MNPKIFKPWFGIGILIILVSLACNLGSNTPAEPPQPVETQAVATEPEAVAAAEEQVQTEAPTEPESQAVASLQDVKEAVIQIESQGTFVDPEFGLILNGAGRGSGFIIDPSGIAVTNNHVVTGAALLQVWVGGESEPRNAKVLGVSECSDLAVIDIDGEGFSYLEWYPGQIEVGMDIYVAGFPLGDPEYTLNKGIISKARASGETAWASVEAVLEYDATSNPGNSGGPVITPDGQVVAVHYAGNANARQAFGISRDTAQEVIGILRGGQNQNSVGVNGTAVSSEDGSLTGIWVSSVQSGSPAEKAGVEAGDIITMMENLVLATDGTMSQYCDVLRSHSPGDTLSLQVLRWSTGDVLEGQMNGDQLEVAYIGDGGTEMSETETESGSAYFDPNASSSGDIIYSTEFDDAVDWYTFAIPDSENFNANFNDSLVYLEVNDRDSTVYMLLDADLPADVRLDAAVETVAGPNRNNISLVCRASNEGWYEFSMNSGGLWFIWLYDDGSYQMLANGASYSINMKKASNEITATCIGNELAFYVNGTEMGSVSSNRFKSGGQVGVSVSTFDIAGAGVEFDWFVTSIP